MLNTPPAEVVWEYWLPPPFASFPFTSPAVRHRVPPHSERSITYRNGGFCGWEIVFGPPALFCHFSTLIVLLFGSVCSPGDGWRGPRAIYGQLGILGMTFLVSHFLNIYWASWRLPTLRVYEISWSVISQGTSPGVYTHFTYRQWHEGMCGAIVVFCSRFARVPKRANITYISLKPEGRGLLRCVRRGCQLSINTAGCYNIMYCRKYSVFLFMA